MTTFALSCNYEGDYSLKLLFVDHKSTMTEVAELARKHIAGVFVKDHGPDVRLRVRRHGSSDFLPDELTVSEAGFIVMETVDIMHVPV